MSKKFTEELTKLSTPDIRSVLRFLNNNAGKHVEATKLASMRHDKALAIIEDKYKPVDIEKALTALASGTTSKSRTEKAPNTPAPSPVTGERRSFDTIMGELKSLASSLNECVHDLKTGNHKTDSGASYLVGIKGAKGTEEQFYIIAAGSKGAGQLDGPYVTAEAAHKAWPEAMLPGPLAKEDDLGGML
jgi:hypothetical protein